MIIIRGELAMQRFGVKVSRLDDYDVLIEPGILGQVGMQLRDTSPESEQAVVVTDRHVQALYGKLLEESLTGAGFKNGMLVVEPGEPTKSLAVAIDLWERLVQLGFRRRSMLLALGGGVITDLTGFVAATYMRGVSYVNVPTTLLAQLDAAIGGKVGVDHPRAKNLIGSFYHPRAVYVDPDTLRTLPVQEIRHGLAEAIKVAVIGSQPLFEFIERRTPALLGGDMAVLTEVVTMAVAAKVALLVPDPYEHDLRRALNFGHTIGHALETALAYKNISHGDGIAIGMATATRIARARGFCERGTADRILALLARVGLPVIASGDTPAQVWQGLGVIRAIRDGHFHEVLPTGIGHYVLSDDLSESDLERYMLGAG